MTRRLLALLLLLTALNGCRSKERRFEDDETLTIVMQHIANREWLEWRIANAQLKAGRTGDALRTVQRSLAHPRSPRVIFIFEHHMERLQTAILNHPLELSHGLIDIAPAAALPTRCCEQPQVIRKLKR